MFLYLCERLVRLWRSQQKVVITKVCADATLNTRQNIITNFSKWCRKPNGSYMTEEVISERPLRNVLAAIMQN